MTCLDHHDRGLFLLGDRDFIPLIEALKAAGKKTFGIFYIDNVAKGLIRTFDFRLAFEKTRMERWHVER